MVERIAIADGERTLRDMLRAKGVDPDQPGSVGETWAVFKEFVVIPVDTASLYSDGVLHQSGTFGVDHGEAFLVDFLRQFEVVDEDGEHDRYEQLHCEFRFPASDETRSFGQFEQWWWPEEGGDARAKFVALVESRPEFVALGMSSGPRRPSGRKRSRSPYTDSESRPGTGAPVRRRSALTEEARP